MFREDHPCEVAPDMNLQEERAREKKGDDLEGGGRGGGGEAVGTSTYDSRKRYSQKQDKVLGKLSCGEDAKDPTGRYP